MTTVELQPSVIYREGPITCADYTEAIAALRCARAQLESMDGGHGQSGCAVCEDGGHTAEACHHNPLVVARRVAWADGAFRCWHCSFVARTQDEGSEHFGLNDEATPQCIERAREAYRRTDEVLCGFAARMSRGEWFTRLEGWSEVERLREEFRDVVEAVNAQAAAETEARI